MRGAKAAKTKVENVVQKLVLDVDGKPVEIALEKMDVNLVKRGNAPESFEIHGTGVVLVGTFPPGVKVDYGENWAALVNQAVSILPRGGDRREPEDSSLTLPGGTPWKVTGGSFTVTELVSDDEDAMALKGRIEIKCETPTGERTLQGTIAVRGHTWG
jgi:hypothetical protein